MSALQCALLLATLGSEPPGSGGWGAAAPTTSALAQHLDCSTETAACTGAPFAHPILLSTLQVQKQQRAEQALKRYKNALQQRAVASWRAGLAEAAEERRQKVEVAAAFARSEVLLQAWLQWMDWVDLQCLRRERLAALFSSLDGGDSRQMRPCWQRWSRAAEQGRRQAARAGELAGRHEAALLQAVLDTWSSYVRAMRADADPDSPFASPRDPSADSELIWDVAGLLAVAPVSSTDSGSGNGSSIAGHTCITVAAPAEVADIPSLAAAMATDAESEAGEANVRHLLRRWRLRNLFGRQR